MRILLLLLVCYGLSACALLDVGPTHYSSVGPSGGANDFYKERARLNFQKAKEELGYDVSTRNLTDQEVAEVHQRIELRRLENKLTYSLEKQQYYSLKPYFANDQERIQFLRLPNRAARERWAQSRDIASVEKTFDPQMAQLIESNDIAKGMSMTAVTQSWGEPDLKEAAGNPIYGNQAWHYRKMVGTGDGYKEEKRVLFFESGRVSGWQTY